MISAVSLLRGDLDWTGLGLRSSTDGPMLRSIDANKTPHCQESEQERKERAFGPTNAGGTVLYWVHPYDHDKDPSQSYALRPVRPRET